MTLLDSNIRDLVLYIHALHKIRLVAPYDLMILDILKNKENRLMKLLDRWARLTS